MSFRRRTPWLLTTKLGIIWITWPIDRVNRDLFELGGRVTDELKRQQIEFPF